MNGPNGIPGNRVVTRRKGVKNHDEMTLPVRLLLKKARKIVTIPTHIVISTLQQSKLKKEEMALRGIFLCGSSSVVEHLLPKQRVASSSLVSRSNSPV